MTADAEWSRRALVRTHNKHEFITLIKAVRRIRAPNNQSRWSGRNHSTGNLFGYSE